MEGAAAVGEPRAQGGGAALAAAAGGARVAAGAGAGAAAQGARQARGIAVGASARAAWCATPRAVLTAVQVLPLSFILSSLARTQCRVLPPFPPCHTRQLRAHSSAVAAAHPRWAAAVPHIYHTPTIAPGSRLPRSASILACLERARGDALRGDDVHDAAPAGQRVAIHRGKEHLGNRLEEIVR